MPRVHRCHALGCHNVVEWPARYCEQHKPLEAADKKKRDYWKYNHITRNRSVSKREQYKFYKTPQWKHLRQLVLDRDYSLCQYCKARGRLTQGNIVDHIVPIEVDANGMRDASNLVTCCKACHQAKTAWEQSYYGTGQAKTAWKQSNYGTGQANALKGPPRLRDVKRIVELIDHQRFA